LIESKLFIAPLYVFPLVHMSPDKLQARSIGPYTVRRQPVAGKPQKGGLKISIIMKEALITHGCAYTLNCLYRNKSDGFRMAVCTACNRMAVGKFTYGTYECKYCHASIEKMVIVNTQYVALELLHIYEAMGIGVFIKAGDPLFGGFDQQEQYEEALEKEKQKSTLEIVKFMSGNSK
jgi:DNA-directed RNA polymerase beta subunit